MDGEVGIDGLRERKRARTRAGTVDAALGLFAERGFDNVTVADICEAAEIAPRTFFRYFTGKEDVLAEPIREVTARVDAAIEGAPAELTASRLLRLIFLEAGGYYVENRARLSVFDGVIRGTPRAAGHLVMLPEQEYRLAARLARRTDGDAEPDWRLRLLVATSVATFRVWRDLLMCDPPEDPLAALADMLDAVRVEGTA